MNKLPPLPPFPKLAIKESGTYCGGIITRISAKMYEYENSSQLTYSKADMIEKADSSYWYIERCIEQAAIEFKNAADRASHNGMQHIAKFLRDKAANLLTDCPND